MNDVTSPAQLVATLIELFPEFAAELADEEVTTYHQIVQSVAPVITGYLQAAPKRTVEEFCEVVNAMVAAGGERENAIATCLLEHASQVRVSNIIRPYLSAAAKQELG